MQAAGAQSLGSTEVTIHVPAAKTPWDMPLDFVRARFEFQDPGRFVTRQVSQYYMFSLNGQPEPSWKKVRLALGKPWIEYAYFAKIQFGSLGEIRNVEESDRAAEEFMNTFLPVILQALPMPSEIEKLKANEG